MKDLTNIDIIVLNCHMIHTEVALGGPMEIDGNLDICADTRTIPVVASWNGSQ